MNANETTTDKSVVFEYRLTKADVLDFMTTHQVEDYWTNHLEQHLWDREDEGEPLGRVWKWLWSLDEDEAYDLIMGVWPDIEPYELMAAAWSHDFWDTLLASTTYDVSWSEQFWEMTLERLMPEMREHKLADLGI